MKFLKEIAQLMEADTKKKKDPRDKSADRYLNYVAGNMVKRDVCAGKLSGTIKTKK